MGDPYASESEIQSASKHIESLRGALRGVLFGQEELIELTLCGVIARGHVLLEGLPGLGKTELVKGLAKALGLTIRRASDSAKSGHQPGPESSLFKVYGTELNKRRTELSVRIAGPQALGWEGPGFEPEELQRTRDWLRARGNSIEGGTSEIQLNIIAKRVLGLPD